MYGWKTRTILIVAAALLTLVAAGRLLAAEPVTGLFGDIVAVSPIAGNGVQVTLSTKDGRKDVSITGDTVLTIPGDDSPSVSDLEVGQYMAATATTVSGKLVAVKALVKPQQPSGHKHVVGVVTAKEGSQVVLVTKDGESIRLTLPVGFTDVEQGTAVTAVVRRDSDTQDLSVKDLRTASQETAYLEQLLQDAKSDPRKWVLKNLETALDAATSRHLSLLAEVVKKAAPDAQNTLTQMLQIQQQRYQQTLQDLDLAPPAIEVTGVIWFVSAADKSVTIRLYPLDGGESINVTATADTKVVWVGQKMTFDELSSRPASETTGLPVDVQYEVGTFKARSIKIVKRELAADLLDKLLGGVGKGEAEGRVIQKNTGTTPQTVVISLTAGGNLTLNVTSGTKVFVADQEVQLLQLPLNSRVNVRYEASTQNAIEITMIMDSASESYFAGVVTELVRKVRSIVVTTTEGERLALSLPDDIPIFRDGTRVPIQEVQIGDLVRSTSRYNLSTKAIAALVLQSPVDLDLSGTVVGILGTTTGAAGNYITVVISDAGLGLLTLRVSDATNVVRNGQASSFTNIRVGDRVVEGAYRLSVTYEQMTKEATSLKLESASILKAQGNITAINAGAGTFTVQPPTGGPITLKFTSNTQGQKDGSPDISLAKLAVGDTVVEATYNATSLEVTKLVVLSSNTLTTRGLIKDIALSLRKVTVGIGEQEVVLTITDSTKIVKDGQAVALAQLSPKDIVIAAYYRLDGTATRIEVRSPNVVAATVRATAQVGTGT